jgi:hypothetical protein
MCLGNMLLVWGKVVWKQIGGVCLGNGVWKKKKCSRKPIVVGKNVLEIFFWGNGKTVGKHSRILFEGQKMFLGKQIRGNMCWGKNFRQQMKLDLCCLGKCFWGRCVGGHIGQSGVGENVLREASGICF